MSLKKCAEILVECRYAQGYYLYHDRWFWQEQDPSKMTPYLQNPYQRCNPFADTLEGRRQADAIEDWFRTPTNDKANSIWRSSGYEAFDHNDKHHQWRLDRIKWCVEQLEKDDG